jgi:hypothetical protein
MQLLIYKGVLLVFAVVLFINGSGKRVDRSSLPAVKSILQTYNRVM